MKLYSPSFPLAEERDDERSDVRVSKRRAFIINNHQTKKSDRPNPIAFTKPTL
ncbi:MAG: hypothetical protein V4553_14580 [Bacteroidota bacterium]